MRSATWHRPAGIGATVFVVSSALPWSPLFGEPFDSPALERIGQAVADGMVPYRDVFVEYPPLGVPVVALPALAPGLSYGVAFKLLEALFEVLAVVSACALLAALGASRAQLYRCAILVGISPLLLGQLALNRFDLWPAALTTLALMLVVRGRDAAGGAVLGMSALAKLYPLAAVPFVAVHVWQERGRRGLARLAAGLSVVFVVVLVPLLAAAQDGLTNSLLYHRNRPLHLESLAGGILASAANLGVGSVRVEFTFGSANIRGALPDALATASSLATIAALTLVAFLFCAAPPRRRGSWRPSPLPLPSSCSSGRCSPRSSSPG